MEALASVSQEQQQFIDSVQLDTGDPQDVLFYSIRPAPVGGVPQLRGHTLDYDEAQGRPLDGLVMAQVDSLEAGIVRGWACSLEDARKPLKISMYVDGVLAGEALAMGPTLLTSVALRSCHMDPQDTSPRPVGFSVRLPALKSGKHALRIFVSFDGSTIKQEVYHSPLTFMESTIEPDAKEELRRKNNIIVRRNAELSSLWNEVYTQFPWKIAEQALEREQSEQGKSRENRLLAVLLVHSVG